MFNNNKNKRTQLYLSSEVGIKGLIKWLNAKGITYVLLRFFENIPELHRPGGDLDILVDDSDEAKVINFILKNSAPKGVPIGVWTVSRPNYKKNLTYYNPYHAKQILSNTEKGKLNAKIPNQYYYLLSFAYHAIYHKGSLSGIPSSLNSITVNPSPENDYLGKIKKLLKKCDIHIPIVNMETLDDFLNSVGWRPNIDTLGKLSLHNKWVYERFFRKKSFKEMGAVVFIIREKVIKTKLSTIEECIKRNKFEIVAKRRVNQEDENYVLPNLRGGSYLLTSNGLKPSYIIVAKDLLAHNNVKQDFLLGREKKQGILKNLRVKKLKEKIRSQINDYNKDANSVHATDNTQEAFEYIKICFHEDHAAIIDRIKTLNNNRQIGFSIYQYKFEHFIDMQARRIKSILKKIKRYPLSKIKKYLVES